MAPRIVNTKEQKEIRKIEQPGYGICEFLLVLKPHPELWNTIQDIKKEFADKYNCPAATIIPPYVTLVKFRQYELFETRILHRLRLVTTALHAVKVELCNYGSFPSHTIYLNITSKVPVLGIIKALREAQHLMKLDNENKPYFITEPHLAIVRMLAPWQYEKAWLYYSNKQFTGRFIADSVLLLMRKPPEKGYRILEKFSFRNVQIHTEQGSLF